MAALGGEDETGWPRVPRVRLYEPLAVQLVEHVERAGLRLGDRLPAERLLAEQSGVSRASVRQALVALEVNCVVEVRHGGGVFLTAPPRRHPLDALLRRTERLSDLLVVREALLVVREALELEIAELAALHHREEDRPALQRALGQTAEEVAHGGTGPADGGVAFHRAVAQAAHDQVLLELLDAVLPARPPSVRQGGGGDARPPGERHGTLGAARRGRTQETSVDDRV